MRFKFAGHENPRSFEKRRYAFSFPRFSCGKLMGSPCFKLCLYIFYYDRDVDYRENRRFDERSDYAGGLKAGRRLSSGTSSNNKVIHLFVLFSSSVAEQRH